MRNSNNSLAAAPEIGLTKATTLDVSSKNEYIDSIIAPIYIYACDDYRFLAVNNAALAQYGYSKAEFLRLSARDIRPEYELDVFYDTEASLPEHYYVAGHFTHLDKQGNTFFVRVYTRRIIYEGHYAVMTLAIKTYLKKA